MRGRIIGGACSCYINAVITEGNETLGNCLSRVIIVWIGRTLLTRAVLPRWVFTTEQIFKDLSVRRVSSCVPGVVLSVTSPMARSS